MWNPQVSTQGNPETKPQSRSSTIPKRAWTRAWRRRRLSQNFFYKFYETLRRRAAQERRRVRNKEIDKNNAVVYDKDMDYDVVEGKESSDDFDDGFKAIKVHAVEIDPFIEEGFEPILEYELD